MRADALVGRPEEAGYWHAHSHIGALDVFTSRAATARGLRHRRRRESHLGYREVVTDEDDILRRFKEAISGAEVDDLRALIPHLMSAGAAVGPERREHRHPRRDEVVTYRVRIDIAHAQPPIWRRLDLRSNITLDVLHQVIQTAFGWWDYHLYRFSLGGDGFDPRSQLFLCPFDVDEGEDEGMPASDIHLDETLREPGDVLHYLYDYGDNWDLTLKLEKVLPQGEVSPIAVCVDGRRAAPPEDCGGRRDAEQLAEVLDDPAAFSVDEVNEALHDPYFVLRDLGLAPELIDTLHRLSVTAFGPDLAARGLKVATTETQVSDETLRAQLRPVQWFLDRAAGDGIELTAAGYLRPADVVEVCAILPTIHHGVGRNNRENQTYQLLEFREALQRLGLLRKYRGRLLITKAGDAARTDPGRLMRHLAARIVPDRRDDFARILGLLVLLHAASGPGESIPIDRIAGMLHELDWRTGDGSPLHGYDLWRVEANVFTVLDNLNDESLDGWRADRPTSATAAALARQALMLSP